ncbi:MAG: hypothetical protein AAFN16_16995 [Pseudomonadota bacterium]
MKDLCADFYHSDKDIAAYPVEWKTGHRPKSLRLSLPLMIDGVVVEGFTLIGHTLVDLPHRNVAFLLNYKDPMGFDRGIHVAKAEWRPIKGHNNKGWGPEEFRLKEQTHSHCHCFDDNVGLGGDLWKNNKLPLALPIVPDPSSFEEFLEFVGKKFRISNVSLIGTPPWDPEWQPDLQL